jgi:hypothetical protein
VLQERGLEPKPSIVLFILQGQAEVVFATASSATNTVRLLFSEVENQEHLFDLW